MRVNITALLNGVSIVILCFAICYTTQKVDKISYSQGEDRIQCLKDQKSLYSTVSIVKDLQNTKILLVLIELGKLKLKVESLQSDVSQLKKEVKKCKKLLKNNHG